MRTLALYAFLLAVAACSRPAGASAVAHCAAGDTALVRDVLYFGRNTPGGHELSDSAWQQFVDQVLTPRFPAGLTIWDAAGQWRGASGQVERERSKVLTLLHAGDSVSDGLVIEVVGEYKQRFAQEAVLRERVATCSRF
ncbi:MAG TPA: DUF3574 domain-containing protein [Gemmatimonadales bacterium]